MELDTIKKIEEIQAKILANLDANKPAAEGIDKDELRDLISKIRSDRRRPILTASKGKKGNKPTLDSLFNP